MKYLENIKRLSINEVSPNLFFPGTASYTFTYNTNNEGLIWAFVRKGELPLNPGNPRVYAPVLRSPLLFHHNTGLSSPTYYPVQSRITQSTTNSYFPHPTSPFKPQSRLTVQPPLSYNHASYPYYSAIPQSVVYSIPNVTYASTVSSKGLALILIATLILVALDLLIVRPQKSRPVVRITMSNYILLHC